MKQGKRRPARLLVGALVALASCGDGGGADLPAPASGRASVGGQLTVDGEPHAGTAVSLFQAGGTLREATTDAEGTFVFTDVEPGAGYALSTEVTIEIPEGGGECTAPGFAGQFSLEDGGFVLALEGEPFAVEADQSIAKDIELSCG